MDGRMCIHPTRSRTGVDGVDIVSRRAYNKNHTGTPCATPSCLGTHTTLSSSSRWGVFLVQYKHCEANVVAWDGYRDGYRDGCMTGRDI